MDVEQPINGENGACSMISRNDSHKRGKVKRWMTLSSGGFTVTSRRSKNKTTSGPAGAEICSDNPLGVISADASAWIRLRLAGDGEIAFEMMRARRGDNQRQQ